MTYANNVVIMNGVIGRSSHHGIHANGFENLHLHDLVIHNFEVAGIALNGFTTAKIEHVEVGPVYQDVPVMGVYTQARIMLPRLRSIAEDNPDGTGLKLILFLECSWNLLYFYFLTQNMCSTDVFILSENA